jgi:hypothetical protein
VSARFIVLPAVVLLTLLVFAPLSQAEPAWDGSTVAFGAMQWTNAMSLPISYYGSANIKTGDPTPLGLLSMQAFGDVVLPDGGSFEPDADSVTMYDGPPGVSGMVLTCWGGRDLPLTPGDGAKDVTVRFTLRDPSSGIVAAMGPSFPQQVTLDTHRPTTVARDPLSCRRGGYVTVFYQADDNLSPTVLASLCITNAGGKTVAKVRLGTAPTGQPLASAWHCRLAKGSYRYAILATDLAGNATAVPGTQKLTVH